MKEIRKMTKEELVKLVEKTANEASESVAVLQDKVQNQDYALATNRDENAKLKEQVIVLKRALYVLLKEG